MSDKVMYQFGAGTLHLPPPWRNFDLDCDITKPLPFESGSTDFVFSEMCIEHVTPQQAWNAIDEFFRILKPGGVVRLVIPDFVKNWREMDEHYRRVNGGVTGAKTDKEHARSIIFGHGHQSMWTCTMLECVLEAIGFVKVVSVPMFFSVHDELRNIEQHHKSVGVECASVESGCCEGTKP